MEKGAIKVPDEIRLAPVVLTDSIDALLNTIDDIISCEHVDT